ncbi:MAG: ABC transporter ATP-binding protein [Candidatus Limisoma sp.]
MNRAVEIKNISKRYGRLAALSDVSISVERGEMFGIIGPDGAGKSTIYKILATLIRPDTGSAEVLGYDTVQHSKTIRTLIGYMPERFSLYPDLTVSENLQLFAAIFGKTPEAAESQIASVYRQLKRFPNRKAGALSGGMKQKLALCCALIHEPKVLLLDEPTTGVDAVSRSEFWDLLAELKQKGITILVSTSYMDEASRCDRIAMINAGRILAVDTPYNLTRKVAENMYSATADNMFKLLLQLRSTPEVVNCYTFGATLHVVGSERFDADEVKRRLINNGLEDVAINPICGDIEDLFIKLTRDE